MGSIRGQDYGDWELVISDNGSTDGTADICRDFAAADARVRYHRVANNCGAAWNYNRVFALSRGTYFKWAAADDTWRPPTSAAACASSTRLPSRWWSAIRTRCSSTTPDSRSSTTRTDSTFARRIRTRGSASCCAPRSCCNAVFGLIRRDALASTRLIGGFNQSDVILLAELSLLGQFCELSEPLFHRRVHAGMSGRANATPDALRQWFDPTGDSARVFTKSRLYAECLSSVHRAQITAGAKALSLGVVLTAGTRK